MNPRTLFTRSLQAFLTIFAVISISFVLVRLMPGGPMDALRTRLIRENPDADMEEINQKIEIYQRINPQESIPTAYWNYLTDILQGNLGRSFHYGDPVSELLVDALPWTIFYTSIGLLVSFSLGIILGSVFAFYQGRRLDFGGSMVAIIGNSVPYYIFAIVLLAFLAFQWGLFPTGGRYSSDITPGLTIEFFLSVIHHATLPILSVVLTAWGGTALAMRGNAISTMGEGYLRNGRLRGLSKRRLAVYYVGWNSILPLYTGLMIAIGGVIGGSVVLETIFRYYGVGNLLFTAVMARDYSLMMGGFLLITIMVVIAILIADLTYGYIDPQAGDAAGTVESYGTTNLPRTLKRTSKWVYSKLTLQLQKSQTSDDTQKVGELPFYQQSNVERSDSRFGHYLNISISALSIAWEDWRTRIGLALLTIFLIMGTAGVRLVESTRMYDFDPYKSPSLEQGLIFGTDHVGQDIFSLTVHSIPPMFKMIIGGAVFATILGTIIGSVSGYRGGLIDRVLMTVSDIVITIPGLPLIFVLAATIEPENEFIIGVILVITHWAGLSRNIRSEVLTLRNQEYVETSRLNGISTGTIIRFDILPNIAPYILISAVSAGRSVIFGSVALYFLGVLPYSNLNWGIILNQAYNNGALSSESLLYWLLVPIVAISALSISFVLMAQGLDRIFNPRIRARHVQDEDKEQRMQNVR